MCVCVCVCVCVNVKASLPTDLPLLVPPEQVHPLHGELVLAAHAIGRHDETQALGGGDVETRIVQLIDHLVPE